MKNNNFMQALWSASAKMTVKSELPELVGYLKTITGRIEVVAKILQRCGTSDRECVSMCQTLSAQVKSLEVVSDTITDLYEVSE